MRSLEFDKKIENISVALAIIATVAFTIGKILKYSFIGNLVFFILVSIVWFLICLPYDLFARNDQLKSKTRFILNISIKTTSAIFGVLSIYYLVIPYSMDVKSYLNKEYASEKGIIQEIDISRDRKSLTSSVHIDVNGQEITFVRMGQKSVDFFRELEAGDLVEIKFLPHSKYGIRIDVFEK